MPTGCASTPLATSAPACVHARAWTAACGRERGPRVEHGRGFALVPARHLAAECRPADRPVGCTAAADPFPRHRRTRDPKARAGTRDGSTGAPGSRSTPGRGRTTALQVDRSSWGEPSPAYEEPYGDPSGRSTGLIAAYDLGSRTRSTASFPDVAYGTSPIRPKRQERRPRARRKDHRTLPSASRERVLAVASDARTARTPSVQRPSASPC